jgi:hypothetical protein
LLRQIVEELEDRLGGQMEDILTIVRASLDKDASAPAPDPSEHHNQLPRVTGAQQQIFTDEEQTWGDHDDGQHMFDPNEVLFDDTGEGAGVEGDLDMEED